MSNAEQLFRDRVNRITEADVQRLLERRESVSHRIAALTMLQPFAVDLHEALEFVFEAQRAYVNASWFAVACLTHAFSYLLEPNDRIPDALPNLGALDDAGVLLMALRLTRPDLEAYRLWRVSPRAAKVLN
jgi:uncharacterized membrane protein YkvA (DUF1232 family)